MTAGSYCYIGPQGIVHGTFVCSGKRKRWRDLLILINGRWDLILLRTSYNCLMNIYISSVSRWYRSSELGSFDPIEINVNLQSDS
jgi:hypothetical protein